jgi:hypothetical protein
MSEQSLVLREMLSTALAPLAAADGGEIYLEELGEQEFSLHWAGRYAGSPAAALLHEEIAVPLIRQLAPQAIVRWSSGHIVPTNAKRVAPLPSLQADSE